MGRLARLRPPASVLDPAMRLYCRAYGVDLSEAEIPTRGFRSFDEFFTRRLKPNARPIASDPNAIVSPADGRLEDLGAIARDATCMVKGKPYRVGELLSDEREAARFEGGQYGIVYLSPRDYHRVHAPVGGPVAMARHVPGTLYPVNAIGLEHIRKLFARNERIVIAQDSAIHGRVITIMVAAIGVGHISLSFDGSLATNVDSEPGARFYGDAAPNVERGEELGIFHLGSTAIVLIEPNRNLTWTKAPGDYVRMGEALLTGRPS